MRPFWLPAELVKLPSMCCFYTVRACNFLHNYPLYKSPVKVVRTTAPSVMGDHHAGSDTTRVLVFQNVNN